MVRNDHYYVEKKKADLNFVIDHTAGKTKEEDEADELLIDSIMFRIIVLFKYPKITEN